MGNALTLELYTLCVTVSSDMICKDYILNVNKKQKTYLLSSFTDEFSLSHPDSPHHPAGHTAPSSEYPHAPQSSAHYPDSPHSAKSW